MTTLNEKIKGLLMFIFGHQEAFFCASVRSSFKDVRITAQAEFVFVCMDDRVMIFTSEMLENYVLSDLEIVKSHIQSELISKQIQHNNKNQNQHETPILSTQNEAAHQLSLSF